MHCPQLGREADGGLAAYRKSAAPRLVVVSSRPLRDLGANASAISLVGGSQRHDLLLDRERHRPVKLGTHIKERQARQSARGLAVQQAAGRPRSQQLPSERIGHRFGRSRRRPRVRQLLLRLEMLHCLVEYGLERAPSGQALLVAGDVERAVERDPLRRRSRWSAPRSTATPRHRQRGRAWSSALLLLARVMGRAAPASAVTAGVAAMLRSRQRHRGLLHAV